MRAKVAICYLASLLVSGVTGLSVAQVPASQDTIVIPGDIPKATPQHAGALEMTINGDTMSNGGRINPNRVYALQEGRWYYQTAPIDINNPTGTLTIAGIPDSAGTTKPVILVQPTNGKDVVINGAGVNKVYGSLKFENIHYQAMELDGTIENELFYCGTGGNQMKQKLTIDNCLFEFCNTDLFDCSNEPGAIGGWPYGSSFFITNSYFRNLFNSASWWGSRIFQCKHPIDTLWVENCTITTGGLTFMQTNELTDFTYVNRNTIVNNQKCWLLSPYKHNEFITSNIFINQSWTGDDTSIVMSGQDPDKLHMSTIDIDTNNFSSGLIVSPRYMINGDTSDIDESQLGLNKMRIFVSNNINYNDPLISSGYYNNSAFVDSAIGGLPSYWAGVGPKIVGDIPCEWMNSRTQAIFTAYAPPNGGFIEQNTIICDPNTVTPGIADASVVTVMGEWNQSEYGDPRFPVPPDIDHTKYIFGDYDPNTIPGLDSLGNKTEKGIGITKFTDLTENFNQSRFVSTIDALPIGSLIWNDSENAAYKSTNDWQRVEEAYAYLVSPQPWLVKNQTAQAQTFALSQNYPNPFNPTTVISYQLATNSEVTLNIYDVLGREVKTLVNERQSAGDHSVAFSAKGLPSGVYFYRLQAGTYSETKKLLLLK